jgi:hypothetical protein
VGEAATEAAVEVDEVIKAVVVSTAGVGNGSVAEGAAEAAAGVGAGVLM